MYTFNAVSNLFENGFLEVLTGRRVVVLGNGNSVPSIFDE